MTDRTDLVGLGSLVQRNLSIAVVCLHVETPTVYGEQ